MICEIFHLKTLVDLPLTTQVMLGEQHSPEAHVDISLHVASTGHPPLSGERQENSQYGIPVSSHTLQTDPLGHGNCVQAVIKENLANINASS